MGTHNPNTLLDQASLSHLRSFVCAVAKGSFTDAAEALYVTQPTVSKHIASLESALGTRLIRRDSHGTMEPTPEGIAAYEAFQAILLAADSLASTVLSMKQAGAQLLHVAASRGVATHVLPDVLVEFRNLDRSAPVLGGNYQWDGSQLSDVNRIVKVAPRAMTPRQHNTFCPDLMAPDASGCGRRVDRAAYAHIGVSSYHRVHYLTWAQWQY